MKAVELAKTFVVEELAVRPGQFFNLLCPAPDQGELWLRQRRLMQPGFHRERLAALADAMTATTAEMLERWRATHEDEVMLGEADPETGRRRYGYPTAVADDAVAEVLARGPSTRRRRK